MTTNLDNINFFNYEYDEKTLFVLITFDKLGIFLNGSVSPERKVAPFSNFLSSFVTSLITKFWLLFVTKKYCTL